MKMLSHLIYLPCEEKKRKVEGEQMDGMRVVENERLLLVGMEILLAEVIGIRMAYLHAESHIPVPDPHRSA